MHDHVMSNERRSDCNWKNSSHAERVNYNNCLDFKLSQLELPIELFNCTNIFCKNCEHTAAIDKICDQIIQCCLEAGVQCIVVYLHI